MRGTHRGGELRVLLTWQGEPVGIFSLGSSDSRVIQHQFSPHMQAGAILPSQAVGVVHGILDGIQTGASYVDAPMSSTRDPQKARGKGTEVASLFLCPEIVLESMPPRQL